MPHRQSREFWDGTGAIMLVGGFFLAPLAWFLDLQVSYALLKWACEQDRRELILLMPLGSLTLIAAGAWMCWWCWARLRHANDRGSSVDDRSYFMAIAGLGMNAVFALLILTSLAPRYLLSPCE